MDITGTVRQIPENRECGGAAAGLRALRDSLRGDRSKGERLRPVCSDAVLAEISARLPVRIEDLEAIPGIGRRFIALYGDIFLSVTRKYSSANAGGTEMRCETAGTLREMEKNLTDLGRGNRMLYQPRLFRLSGLDLTDLDADIAGFLAGVSEISVSPRDPHYKRISELIRESGRELRDRGRSDLYAAFPFAEGILPDGFPVKAPLVLYPAAAVREKGEIRITLDGSREAVYNAALILAAMKASGKDGAVPDCCAGSSAVPFDVAAGFYRENGIVLRNLPEGYEKFRSGDPECSGNSLKTSAYAVLGRYPIYSCAVQRDFETILSGNSVSGILDRFTSRRGSCAVPEPESGVPVTAGKLDSSQERAVSALENSEGLVICGPPGTGKSQVITEAAVSAVLGGKNVLIVSEKKAALDVVRSRLGTLSRYCMMIDDAGNKESFYRQLSSALEPEPEKPCPDLRKCIAGSAKAAAKLESLEKGLYGERESGMVPADLYSGDLARGSSPYDAAADNSLSSGVTGLDYGSVLSLHGYFSEAGRAERYIRYRKLMEKHRIFLGMRSDLTKIELSEFRRKLQDLTDPSYSRVRISKEASLITAEYFTSCNSSISGIISGDPMQVIAALDRYQLYSEGSGEFGDLPAEWKSYGNGIAELSEEQGISPEESEKLMFARMQHFKIREFDGAYDSSGLEAFGEYSRMMSRRSEEQRAAARGVAESLLRERADRMKRSARFGEMERIITSSRRWSPPRFAGRFAYELSEGIRIWLMTPETVSEVLPLEMGMFDLLIIDEASQMYAE
ncbi:MAG: HRDC domain-containing protein, partial [Candidatus Methanomethylophilaceae archaeon]|nr:HRDC domain-containing protein [Candidatus Methanomethylophilaceae archaeon]